MQMGFSWKRHGDAEFGRRCFPSLSHTRHLFMLSNPLCVGCIALLAGQQEDHEGREAAKAAALLLLFAINIGPNVKTK